MTPTKIARLRELRAEGRSERDVARELGVSQSTVREWERRTRPQTPDEAEVEALVATPILSAGDSDALAAVKTRSSLVQNLLKRLTPGVEQQTFPATSYVTLARYGDELARVIAELTPPAPKDPDQDPDVIEAERTLVTRLERLIVEAEARTASKGARR